MAKFAIYNANLGDDLGTYEAETEDQALDAMARAYSFADYNTVISEYGIDRDSAKAELQITRVG